MAVGAFAAYNFNLRVDGCRCSPASLLAGSCAAAVGVVFGLPSLRLSGFYLAVSTLAAQFFVQWALTKFGWFSNYSASGVIAAPPLHFGGSTSTRPIGRYLLRPDDRHRPDRRRGRLVAVADRAATSSPCATTRPPPG